MRVYGTQESRPNRTQPAQVARAFFILQGQRQENHLYSAKAKQAGKQSMLSGRQHEDPRAVMQMLTQLHKE